MKNYGIACLCMRTEKLALKWVPRNGSWLLVVRSRTSQLIFLRGGTKVCIIAHVYHICMYMWTHNVGMTNRVRIFCYVFHVCNLFAICITAERKELRDQQHLGNQQHMASGNNELGEVNYSERIQHLTVKL